MDKIHLLQALAAYAEALSTFLQVHGLARACVWPVDHVAIKLRNAEEYESAMRYWHAEALRTSFVYMNARRLGTVELCRAIMVPGFGNSGVLEVMEPRPGALVTTAGAIDHIELRPEKFEGLEEILSSANVAFEVQDNGQHVAYVVIINDLGQEVKFTNTNLKDLVSRQIARGESIIYS